MKFPPQLFAFSYQPSGKSNVLIIIADWRGASSGNCEVAGDGCEVAIFELGSFSPNGPLWKKGLDKLL